jgi:hypothetical protein
MTIRNRMLQGLLLAASIMAGPVGLLGQNDGAPFDLATGRAAWAIHYKPTVQAVVTDVIVTLASLELPLYGIAQLTDAQRNEIERLEQTYRDRMLAASRDIVLGYREVVHSGEFLLFREPKPWMEKARIRIDSLFEQRLVEARTVLTQEQQLTFDENVRRWRALRAPCSAEWSQWPYRLWNGRVMNAAPTEILFDVTAWEWPRSAAECLRQG